MQILVNNGLLSFSKNNFVAAQESFQKAASAAAKAEPSNLDGEISSLTENFQSFTLFGGGGILVMEKGRGKSCAPL